MLDTAESYRNYWSTLTDRSPREVYVPEALRLADTLRRLIDDVREGRSTDGEILVPGPVGRRVPDQITVGLARFQSYRARTEAALVQELTDLVADANAFHLSYEVDSESSTVSVKVW